MQQTFKLTILLLLAAATFTSSGQPGGDIELVEQVIESIIEDLEPGTDHAMILEDLEYLAENPLNLNTATRNQLSRLHLLNPLQIEELIGYQDEYGPVYSLYELNALEGFSPRLLKRLAPFVRFGPPKKDPFKFSDQLRFGKHETILRSLGTVQKPRGYKAKEDGTIPFEGNRARYYARYRFRSGEFLSAGFTAEKDPGEAFFTGSCKQGFDFYSAHLSFRISPAIEKIIVGDYSVRSGQGLALWQGFSTGKSALALDISKTGQGIRPYTSTGENHFFRGIAAALNFKNTRMQLFFSNKKNDANLVFDTPDQPSFSSLQSSGYHRTENEIADKNSVKDWNTGLLITSRFNHLSTGITVLYRRFELPFIRSDQLYNRFRFKGKTNFVAATHYYLSKGKFRFFGEGGVSRSKGTAVLQGSAVHLHDQIQVSALFRHFGKTYHALWAAPFANGSSASNETGFYLGTRILPFKFTTLTAYTDFFRSPWVKFTTAAPSKGWETMVRAHFDFPGITEFYVQTKTAQKERKKRPSERYLNINEYSRKSRIHFIMAPSGPFSLKTRFEHIFFKGETTENGYMAFQDIRYQPEKGRLKLTGRIAWFHTQSYYSRIYAYENDLLYSFSIPAFFGKGWRTYLLVKYKTKNNVELNFKVGNTVIKDAETVGSGYNEISGNKKTTLKIQLRLKI